MEDKSTPKWSECRIEFNTFEPSQLVVVRKCGHWFLALFSHYECGRYYCKSGNYYCTDDIKPYEGNEHLVWDY